MTRQPEKRARAEAILGELAELGLMLARELAVRARESEDAGETVALAQAFQKTSRAVRLTLALDFKLERDAAREAAEAAEAASVAAPPEPAPISPQVAAAQRLEARKTRVDRLLNRLLWNEAEGDSEDYEILCDDLTARMNEAARHPDFETLPVEAIAERMAADMGLRGRIALSLREVPPPDGQGEPPPLADTG